MHKVLFIYIGLIYPTKTWNQNEVEKMSNQVWKFPIGHFSGQILNVISDSEKMLIIII
jgi:hypothetical protein